MSDLKLDHVTIVVPDMDEARADYSGLGFTDMDYSLTSANQKGVRRLVIPFADGTSLHLVSVPRAWKRWVLSCLERLDILNNVFAKAPLPTQRIIQSLARSAVYGHGLADCALQTQNIDLLATALSARGYTGLDVTCLTQSRSDGLPITLDFLSLPFDTAPAAPLIFSEVSDPLLRIPAAENCFHVNGVRGIARVVIPVPDFDHAVQTWQAITGSVGRGDAGQGATDFGASNFDTSQMTAAHQFQIGTCCVVLAQPRPDTHLHRWLRRYGARPFEVGLWTRANLKPRHIPLSMAAGAQLCLMPLLPDMADPAPWSEEEMHEEVEARVAAEQVSRTANYSDFRTPPDFKLPSHLPRKVSDTLRIRGD